MSISSEKIFSFLKSGSALFFRYARLLLFLLLVIVFCFALFQWYVKVYSPEDRIEELKKEILQSENKEFDVQKFERVLNTLDNRKNAQVEPIERKDIFYR